MSYTAIAEHFPRFLRRHVLHFEFVIEDAVKRFGQEARAGSWVLDAGAGECLYARFFPRQRYCGVDLAVGNAAWNGTIPPDGSTTCGFTANSTGNNLPIGSTGCTFS